jgi:hypothetical protein
MPTFVDFAGMNTLVSSSFDDTNTITSDRNTEVGSIDVEDTLVGINLHRNGPYGYSTWKQIRVSENPLSRYHKTKNTLTFVTNTGPVRNVLQEGELRVRDRYSALYSFTEPAVCQKSYPLVWNVGRHFKDEDGNLAPEPEKFSIISSYGNSQIGFANEEVNKLMGYDPDDNNTEYAAIKDMYLENGLNKQDSPLTYWEFLQYRETVFPRAENQFIDKVRNRPEFESFFRHNREDRTKNLTSGSFGWTPYDDIGLGDYETLSQSAWILDEHQGFLSRNYASLTGSIDWTGATSTYGNYELSRNGEGILLSTHSQFWYRLGLQTGLLNAANIGNVEQAAITIDEHIGPAPLYMRRISLDTSQSVSNPSGMEIYGTSSTETLFQGGALWEAGANRYIKDSEGNYVHAPKYPFYDTYENYVEELKKHSKNYAVVPEFRMSSQIEDFKRTDNAIELDMLEVSGGISGSSDSSKQNFYEIYSNSDFMKQFELIDSDHKEFTNGKVLSLRCKAVKKFLPYEGFYPAQRTVDLAKRFYDSFGDNIDLYNANNVQLSDFNYGKQMVMTPLFAPGVLFNTIKSGVAVDYPIMTGSLSTVTGSLLGLGDNYYIETNNFDKRIPFEALIEPKDYLSRDKLTSNEPHPSGNLSASATWDGEGDDLYSLMANNFLAEVPEFFLPNGQLTSIVSKRQKDIKNFEAGRVYGMRVRMRRSMNRARAMVYHSGSESYPYHPPQDIIRSRESGSFENFTMYSRPSAFGPPTYGYNFFISSGEGFWHFDEDRVLEVTDGSGYQALSKGSESGYNYPFTPPYYHGEGWCEMWFTASANMTIQEIQNSITASYTRFDSSFYKTGSYDFFGSGPQSFSSISSQNFLNKNAVQLSASLNLFGIGKVQARGNSGDAGSLVVDTAVDEESRWVIQTKFETPMLNFAHVSGSDHLTLPQYGSGSVPRGMWHQHGRIPEENEGVFIQVGAIPDNYQTQVLGISGAENKILDLSSHLGFSGVGTKLGRLASSKVISEAVVAVPFVEEKGRKKFFKLDKSKVQMYKDGDREGLTTGEAQSQIGRTVLNQMDKMKKFIFPPSFDFLNFDNVEPVAMYVFEFSHTLSQQDLSDIWQNLPPDIGLEMEESEVAITHPLLQKELLGAGGESGNDTIDMPHELKWMVFKVKQRAANNYFKKTVLRNPEVNTKVESGNVTQDEFGPTTAIQYNWPYDFFSLVEMVKIDAEVEMGNADFTNYTDNIPAWNAVTADQDKVEYIVGGLEDDPIPETITLPTPKEAGAEELEGTKDPVDPQSGQGNAFIAQRFEELEESFADIQDRILGKMGGDSPNTYVTPTGQDQRQAGEQGSNQGVATGGVDPLEEIDEGPDDGPINPGL